jgi:myo-inositol-1(or 4)-monophosphatase
VRGEGAYLDHRPIVSASTTEVERSVVGLSGWPHAPLPWRQFRALGSAALSLCDVAAGHLDGYLDGEPDQHAPWDYLGGLLVCQEANAVVIDAEGRDLLELGSDVRRQLVAGGTKELVAQLREGAGR